MLPVCSLPLCQTTFWCPRPWAHQEKEKWGRQTDGELWDERRVGVSFWACVWGAWSENTNACQTDMVHGWRRCRTPKCLHHVVTLVICKNKLILVGERQLFLWDEDEESLCVSLYLSAPPALSGFNPPSSPTRVSQDWEPHGALLAGTMQTENKWWTLVSNFSHISVETGCCQVCVWLSRQTDQRISFCSFGKSAWRTHSVFNC